MTITQDQKLAFADAIAKSTLFLDIAETAKIIAAATHNESSLEEIFAKLRDEDILDNDNVPTEIAHHAGIIGTRRTFVDDEDDGSYRVISYVVTGKGLIHMVNLFIDSNNDSNYGEADNA